MALRTSRVDPADSVQSRVLWGMLTDKQVLGAVAARWTPKLFASEAAALVAGWAVTHWERYHRPPAADINASFDAWCRTNPDPALVGLVETLLGQIATRWSDRTLNADVVLDEARGLFLVNSVHDLKLRIEGELEGGTARKAAELIAAWREVDVGLGQGSDLLTDDAAWDAMFETAAVPVVEFPGAMGSFFKNILVRDSLVSFLGIEKIGKSYWLQHVAWQALLQGQNVAYFECGDSSDAQVRERFAARIMGRPLEPDRYLVPTALDHDGKLARVSTNLVTFKDAVDPDLLRIERRRLDKRLGGGRFKLDCHPNSSLSVREMDARLEGWGRDGWHPALVVVDYADILAPETAVKEYRHQIDETWRALRALSQRRHCLVLTATQASKEAYANEWVLKRKHITEDKRKLSHVNFIVGINQKDKEKEHGVYRLNVPCGRKLTFGEETCLWCAGNLGYANPAMLATF